jgi:hypothetical protein
MLCLSFLKAIVMRIPGMRELRNWHAKRRTWRTFPGSAEYWQRRYENGGNSGSGSSGALAEFKASVLNRFVKEHGITSVIEFGCGDGSQLKLAEYPTYIGLDVARKAVQLCRNQSCRDMTKSFFLYDPEYFVDHAHCFSADLAISLDVVYHLVEDDVYEKYMAHLFGSAKRFVIIYSSNRDIVTNSPHEKHRHFSDYVEGHFPEWQLLEKVENPFPLCKYPPPLGSLADFYVYERIATKKNYPPSPA